MAQFTKSNGKPKKTHFKSIVIAFDTSSTNTGYAVLIDGKPYKTNDKELSVGSTAMVEYTTVGKRGQQVKPREVEYETYGDRMSASIAQVEKMYSVLAPLSKLNEYHIREVKEGRQGIIIDDFQIVFEVSEIPNGKNVYGQSLTTVRKLALYTGLIFGLMVDAIKTIMASFTEQMKFKIVSPTEWQLRLGFWKSNLTTGQEIKKYGMKYSKYQSINRANEYLRLWGAGKTDDDDMADAINIATVATKLRDNVAVKSMAKRKKDDITKYVREQSVLSTRLAEYKAKGTDAKAEFISNIQWAKQANRKELTAIDKRKHTKYANLSFTEYNEKPPYEFLTPADKRTYEKIKDDLATVSEKILSMRKEKVIH